MLSVSPELSSIVGSERQSRAQIVGRLWVYIKKKKLQDGRIVKCDIPLRVIFGKEQISMFEMAGLISHHVSTREKYVPRNR